MKDIGFAFLYREIENGEQKRERFIISAKENDIENACEIAMLKFLKKHGYHSGKIESIKVF